MPFAKNVINELRSAKLVNNSIWFTAGYGISLEWVRENKIGFFVSYGNGDAGYSMGVIHKKKCNNYNSFYSDEFTAGTANEKRLITGIIFQTSTGKKNKTFYIKTSIQPGLGIDFNSNEDLNSGRFQIIRINRCGEEYYLKDTAYDRRKIGLVLPVQINFNSFFHKKPSFTISLFYHVGLSRHYTVDIDYTTSSYIDKTRFLIKGSSLGFRLSYPIRLIQLK